MEYREIIGNTTTTPNPQSDWEQSDATKPDYIKNKPEILTETDVKQIIAETGGGGGGGTTIIVQADWAQTDSTKSDYIKNKPTIAVDGALSTTSTNPVQNKVVSQELAEISESHNTLADDYRNHKNEYEQSVDIIGTALSRLSGEVEVINQTSETALSIAKGANQAVSFYNYNHLTVTLNDHPSAVYCVGQNLYLAALNIPDLWVYQVYDSYIKYDYVDDATFLKDMQDSSGILRIGCYEVSMLETQKVDLTDYATKEELEEVDTSSAEFADWVIENVPTKEDVYTKDEVDNKIAGLSPGGDTANGDIEPNPNTLAQRNEYGSLFGTNGDIGGAPSNIEGYIEEDELINRKTLEYYAIPKPETEIDDDALYGRDSSGQTVMYKLSDYATKAELEDKQDQLTFDNRAQEGSSNPVTSDGIKQELKELSIFYDSEIGKVASVAMGANQAVAFYSYGQVVAELNEATSSKYNIGQNIYVQPVNTPDLWVYNVHLDHEPYNFSSEENFIQDLKTNKFIRIGYYSLAMLETQVVNLEDYVSVDKGTYNTIRLYGRYGDSFASHTFGVANADARWIPGAFPQLLWDNNGQTEPTGYLIAHNPVNPYHVATKEYVDNAVEASGGGNANVVISDTEPENAPAGTLWFDTSESTISYAKGVGF